MTLTTTQNAGSWSVTPSTELPYGTFTVAASQSDSVGNRGVSTGSTFTIAPPVPVPVLTGISPSSGPTAGGNQVGHQRHRPHRVDRGQVRPPAGGEIHGERRDADNRHGSRRWRHGDRDGQHTRWRQRAERRRQLHVCRAPDARAGPFEAAARGRRDSDHGPRGLGRPCGSLSLTVVALGSTVDATHGSVRIIAAAHGHGTQTATLAGAAFTLAQGSSGLLRASLVGKPLVCSRSRGSRRIGADRQPVRRLPDPRPLRLGRQHRRPAADPGAVQRHLLQGSGRNRRGPGIPPPREADSASGTQLSGRQALIGDAHEHKPAGLVEHLAPAELRGQLVAVEVALVDLEARAVV